jgi:uncharacterized membrane protein YraQ (UPF0718 family)
VLLDVRRSFLLDAYAVRTGFGTFAPIHAVMAVAALVGTAVCYHLLRRQEARVSDSARYSRVLGASLLALLVLDLLAYRGIPAARSLASGAVGADWLRAFGAAGWMKPLAQATSYLFAVWHATLLGILIAGLAMLVFPAGVGAYSTRQGFRGSLLGGMIALSQPFCSCCSSVIAPSLVHHGSSKNFVLSFVVGAPMLNVTTLILALALLPVEFAATRIIAGVLLTVGVTYVALRVSDLWSLEVTRARPASERGLLRRIAGLWSRLFDLHRADWVAAEPAVTPSRLIAAWCRISVRLALVLVPILWCWSVVAAGIFAALPSGFGNNFTSVLLTAAAGTFFMISTWSEIPIALQLLDAGLNGPAAALLVVLPATSLPCMMLLWGSLRQFRIVGLLSIGVMASGVIAGAMFL